MRSCESDEACAKTSQPVHSRYSCGVVVVNGGERGERLSKRDLPDATRPILSRTVILACDCHITYSTSPLRSQCLTSDLFRLFTRRPPSLRTITSSGLAGWSWSTAFAVLWRADRARPGTVLSLVQNLAQHRHCAARCRPSPSGAVL